MTLSDENQIIWKNEYAEDSKESHLKRFLFLLELFTAFIKPKDYVYFDEYGNIEDIISFANTEYFNNLEKSFLMDDFKTTRKYKYNLLIKWSENVHQSKKRNTIIFDILFPLGIGLFVFGLFLSIPQIRQVYNDECIICILIGAFLTGFTVLWKLYSADRFKPYCFLYMFTMKSTAIAYNLIYEKSIIEVLGTDEKHSDQNGNDSTFKKVEQNSGYMLLKEYVKETETYFRILCDLGYLAIFKGKITCLRPFSLAAFAEMITDKDFLFFQSKDNIPDMAYINLFGKKFNQIQQREKGAALYPDVKTMLIEKGAPTTK